MNKLKKRAQEEIIGFVLIVILVMVVVLVFVGFSIKNNQKEDLESYEVESFIQSVLQYTSDCKDNLEFLSLDKLVLGCYEDSKCIDEKSQCDVLKEDLDGIVKNAWEIENRPIKGYEMRIFTEDKEIYSNKQGNETKNYKGAVQVLNKDGNEIQIVFRAYS